MAVYDVSGTPKEVISNRKHAKCSPSGLHQPVHKAPLQSNAEGLITQIIREKQDQKAKNGYIQHKTTKADDPF